MRACQPLPIALNASRISASKRMVVDVSAWFLLRAAQPWFQAFRRHLRAKNFGEDLRSGSGTGEILFRQFPDFTFFINQW